MTRPLVLVDCDGVLSDFVGAVLDHVFARTGVRHEREAITDWDMSAIGEWARDEAFFALLEPGACSALEPLPGAQKGMGVLREFADVRIVTAPFRHKFRYGATWHSEREEWLREHFGIAAKDVVHTHHKDLIRGDFFIDDHPKHIAAWSTQWPSGKAFQWAVPHNGNVGISEWRDVLDEVLP